jgi:O-antigen ligase
MRHEALRRPLAVSAFTTLAAGNAAVGVGIATGRLLMVGAAALLPAALVATAGLIASNRAVLVFAALALDFTAIGALDEPITGLGGVYPADVILVLAIASWVAAWLIAPADARPKPLRTPLLGWPLVLFAVVMLVAVLRGHEAYGASLLGQPLRLFLYAGIGLALTGITPRAFYQGIVVVFYAGTVYQALLAAYHLSAGTSVTPTFTLSTGGIRVISLGASMYLTGALVLALINLGHEQRANRRALHVVIALLALFGITLSFGRAAFAIAAIVLPLMLVLLRRTRRAVLALLPLFIPALVIAALYLPRTIPSLFPTLEARVTADQSTDINVRWRREANVTMLEQIREKPIQGVGYGRTSTFVFDGERRTLTQDAHNSFLFIGAVGGLIALGSFLLLVVFFLRDGVRALRGAVGVERGLVIWAVITWFVFMVNGFVGPVLTQPRFLLTIWILMLLPAAVLMQRRDTRARA